MSPVRISKTSGGKYRVSHGGTVSAKATTKEKAVAQANLLRAKEHNPSWKPTGQKARKGKR